jgi:TPR repeat protein
MYKAGLSVHRDYKQALAWYRKAADQNLADAEQEMGYFYQSGLGAKRDYAQALSWYRRSAIDGSTNAENQLGYMAEEGLGQTQNYAQALSWYEKAAEQGNTQAQENIGYMIQHGSGVPQDFAKAMYWFSKAAVEGNGDAMNQLGWMYQYGQGVGADSLKALSWYQLSAGQGNVHGERNVEDLTSDLEEQDGGAWQNATTAAHDAVIDEAQRWVHIQDLRGRIDAVESDALYQEDLASQLEHMDKGKTDRVSKLFKAMGSVGAVKYHVLAAKDREDAARLRDQLAQLENQRQTADRGRTP